MQNVLWHAFLGKALLISYGAHKGQEREGTPYILHPLRVMDMCGTIQQKVVALLHDVVEDSPWTIQDLRDEGFPNEILDAVEAITHYDEESHQQYIQKVCSNNLSLRVKRNDSKDNLDKTTLLDDSHPKKTKWTNKYIKNLEIFDKLLSL